MNRLADEDPTFHVSTDAETGQTLVACRLEEVTLQAEAPLAELFGYANAIRSLNRGRASYSMRPARFEQVSIK